MGGVGTSNRIILTTTLQTETLIMYVYAWIPLDKNNPLLLVLGIHIRKGPRADTIMRMRINVSPSCACACQLTTFLIVTDMYIRTYIMRIDPSFRALR